MRYWAAVKELKSSNPIFEKRYRWIMRSEAEHCKRLVVGLNIMQRVQCVLCAACTGGLLHVAYSFQV